MHPLPLAKHIDNLLEEAPPVVPPVKFIIESTVLDEYDPMAVASRESVMSDQQHGCMIGMVDGFHRFH
ncbi:hypothetical protein A9P44_14300 [Paenibacillus polymyxa]|nr:hypothetical protein A9P44_14300 [Paenibacillus polymyxa]